MGQAKLMKARDVDMRNDDFIQVIQRYTGQTEKA